MFFSTFAMDTWRWSNNNMDQKYAPWPFKPSGAISMTNEEHEQTMIIAAAASVTIALADFVIVKIKQYKKAQKARNMPDGSPIVIKQIRPEAGAPPAEPSGDPQADAGSVP
jgi:nitric oxide reductase large subunit